MLLEGRTKFQFHDTSLHAFQWELLSPTRWQGTSKECKSWAFLLKERKGLGVVEKECVCMQKQKREKREKIGVDWSKVKKK